MGANLYACRWPNGDLSLVLADDEDDARDQLDEFGNADRAEIFEVEEFLMDFRLTDDGSLEVQSTGECLDRGLMAEAYPDLAEVRDSAEYLDADYSEADELVLAAVERERLRPLDIEPQEPLTEYGNFVSLEMDLPAAKVRQLAMAGTPGGVVALAPRPSLEPDGLRDLATLIDSKLAAFGESDGVTVQEDAGTISVQAANMDHAFWALHNAMAGKPLPDSIIWVHDRDDMFTSNRVRAGDLWPHDLASGAGTATGAPADHPDPLGVLVQATSDGESVVRRYAAEALGDVGDTYCVPWLVRLMSDHEQWDTAFGALLKVLDRGSTGFLIAGLSNECSEVRRVAAELLGRRHEVRAVPALLRMLADGDFLEACAASEALALIGDESCAEPMMAILANASLEPDRRIQAIRVLGMIRHRPAVPMLREVPPALRWSAMEALGRIGDPDTVSLVVDALTSGDPFLRGSAALALGESGLAAAVQPLTHALTSDPSTFVRMSAATALGRFDDPIAVAALVEELADEGSPAVAAAAEALAAKGASTSSALVDALKGSNGSGRVFSALALGEQRYKPAVPSLLEALTDPKAAIRRAAAEALGKIGDASAVPDLIAALRDADLRVRPKAAEALGLIRDRSAVPALILCLQEAKTVATEPFEHLDDPRVADWMDKKEAGKQAARALGELADAQAVPALVDALSDDHPDIVVASAEAIAKIAGPSAKVLADNLVRGEGLVRVAAARALALIARAPAPCGEGLPDTASE